MDIKELNRKDVDELMRIGGDLEVADTDGLAKDELVDRIFGAAKKSDHIFEDEEIYRLIRSSVDEWSFS